MLPWAGSYRGYDWNDPRGARPGAPVPPGEVLIDDRLFVDGTTIPSEDPLVDEVADALEAADPASALRTWASGGSWSRRDAVGSGAGWETAYDGDQLTLVDLGAEVLSEPRRSGSTTLIW